MQIVKTSVLVAALSLGAVVTAVAQSDVAAFYRGKQLNPNSRKGLEQCEGEMTPRTPKYTTSDRKLS
jgi:hypothetical protein